MNSRRDWRAGLTTAMPTDTAKPRYLQSCLSSALLIGLLIGIAASVGSGAFFLITRKARSQRDAASAIVAAGGSVQYDYQRRGTEPKGPLWQRTILGDDFFSTIIAAKVMSDGATQYVEQLTELEDMRLENITDAGLENLKGLHNLTELDLSKSQVTDSGLKYLKGLTKLVELNLSDTQVTEAGLAHLRELPIEQLVLSGTRRRVHYA